ncbi:zeatin O-glucosyltransferase-like [Salvia hispanica]|uniref:zeatin O-glucosyltransferase-like n=1 Tax=Salvia hispanica TaxID=49212 RepID=UPI00200944E7|nr:zeatin O-glucosyltransferase-like [Salvia hispanica]
MATNQEEVPLTVLMVPLAAQGHLNQLLHLSRLMAARDIPVHYVAGEAHIRQARTRLHGWDPSSIHFHHLPTPPFTNPPPNPNSPTKFPAHLIPSLVSSMHLRQPVFELAQRLAPTTRRLAVLYDSSLPYVVQDVPTLPNAAAYCFHSIAAFSVYSFHWEYTGKTTKLKNEASFIEQVPSVDGCFPPEFVEVMQFQHNLPKISSGDIYNTSRVIEAAYLDLLANEKSTGTGNIWAVGPFNPVSVSETESKQFEEREACLKWLDTQSLNSVILVSFGSTCSLSDDQISEIAEGLEKSGQRFIWVIRDADRGNIFQGDVRRAPLPEMYEERVRERGLILRDWAPQLEILGHRATGGFMTHCGWNSCIESISMGVPVAAWPMHSDQPRNAVLMTKVLGIGVEAAEWAHRDRVVPAAAVESAVRRLMASEEGVEIRKRAEELGDAVRKSMLQGGVSVKEMDSFIAHITKSD